MTAERRLLACGVAAWLATFTIAATAQDAQPAAAKGGGGDEPIEISSDRLVLEQNQQLATFTGNVDAVQGDTTLRSDVLRVFYLSDEERKASPTQQTVKRLEADGKVIITQPGETAEGDSGVYDLAAGKMVLIGNVVLTQGKSVVKGDRLDVDRNTGVSVVTANTPATGGATRAQRVRALFVPEPEPAAQTEAMTVSVAPDLLELERRAATAAPPISAVADGKAVLSARHLAKHYGSRTVLRDVSLSLHRGEAVGLLGPNGAGKTTCFYIITGLIAADAGQVLLDERDITALPMYRRARLGIGYLPQEASIFRGLNVEDNVRAVLEVAISDRQRRESTLERLLSEFGLAQLRRSPALALSGGERRRVEIARALAASPSFILLDEPLAGIDPINVGEIRDLVGHLKDRGLGVLITDHNVRDTLDIIDRAYILHDGAVLREGTPAEIVADPAVRRVYLGERFSL